MKVSGVERYTNESVALSTHAILIIIYLNPSVSVRFFFSPPLLVGDGRFNERTYARGQ